jgi:hypothetical protein
MQMLPLMCSDLAARLFSLRWWFFVISIAAFGGLAIILTFAPVSMGLITSAVAGPLVVVSWVGLCLCIWFHPERGNLQPKSRIVGKLPHWMQSWIRWYAAILLIIFLLAGLILFPLFALTAS